MKNNFLSKAYGGVMEAQRKLYGLGLPRQWKVITSTLLLLFTFSVGQMWGACDDPGTKFSLEFTASAPSSAVKAAKNGGTVDASTYATISGGSAQFVNSSTSSDIEVVPKSKQYFKLGSADCKMNISLTCALKEGDIIEITDNSAKCKITTGSYTLCIADKNTHKVVCTADWEDATSISIEYDGSGVTFSKVYVKRPNTITLNATTNGGTAVSPIKALSGDKVALTHAFKKDNDPLKYYKFKGWYEAISGGDPVANYYTVTGDKTLYAQFEDNPASGTMFSLVMQDELKPAANCTIKTAAGFVASVDMLTYATISGGAAYFKNASSNNHAVIQTDGKFNFAGSNAVMEIPLDFPLANGDQIITNFSDKVWLSASTTKPSSGPFVDGTNQTYTVAAEDGLANATTLYLYTGVSGANASTITITRPTPHTLSYAISPDHDPAYATVTLGATSLVEGATTTATYSAIDAAYEFDEWQISGTDATLSSTSTNPTTITMGSADATVTLKLKAAVTKYTITYNPGAYGTGIAIPDGKKDEGVDFMLSDATYSRDGYVQTGWSETDGGDKAYDLGGTYSTDDDEELFPFWTPVYTVTKGAHDHGDFTISPASLVAGGTVTLDPTPADGYMFSAWEVVKTSDASATGITVTNKQFEMPAYGVTVNATFVTDTRKKILYLTTTNEATTIANDKLYAALKDDYKVTIAAPDAQTLTNYDLVVLHESINGKAAAPDDATNRKQAVLDAKTTSVPVLNTKTYFYNSGRWDWGTPNNGQADQRVATLNSGYCNITDHPIFNDVTISAGAVTVLANEATGNTMQPVVPSSGKEGYLLATTPNKEGGESSYAIQEIPAGGFRGASSGKYILISVSNAGLNNLTADGQKLFQNAAAYLIGSTAWEPINAITSPEVTASPSAAYSAGDNIALTASATGAVATTTYTWYKGATWAAAEEAGAIKAAATATAGGNTFGVTGCAAGDAGIYWCVISNGTGCDAKASLEVTVSTVSYNIAFASAHGTAPTATTGVAYTLPELSASGWVHQGWTASIDVTVDAATVDAGTLIANGKVASFADDVTFTAVWKQEFQVTFNLKGHGDPIAPQDIVDGGKVTKPADLVAVGFDFGGWFTDEECTAGNEWDFNNDVVTEDTELFAKWTAFDGCTLLVPATSGDAPAVGDPISMQSGSKGGSMSVIGTPLSYNTYGLGFDSNSSAKAKVTINNEIQEGTVISLTLVANGTSSPRGLHLYSGDGATKIASIGWTSTVVKYTEATFTYTVQSTDVALIGTNEFQLWRNSSVFLKQLTVTNCGDPVIFHNLTSEIAPDHDPAYATVTLGASSVREGYTTTATYSDIDAAYEFDEWQISGTGASIADASANPAVITMGTADAVVTLKLKVATPKHTVTFNKMGKGADIASQLVAEGALVSEPSVTEPEGWLLEGWYKESTFENKWDFASDVMSTSDIELFANWVADTSIKLINKSTGAINTTNFTTAVAAEADVDGEKGALFNANRDAISSVSALNEMVQYNATTTQTKIQLVMYNTSSAEKTIHLFKVAEGDDAATLIDISIDGNSRKTTEYYTFNSDKNRSFYITVSDKKVQILQMRVVESGTALKQFGQAGYSLNLNKGRIFAKSGNAVNFEGATVTVNSDYKVLNNSKLSTNSYIQFNNAVANTTLKVTRSGGNYYVSQDPEDKGTSYNKNEEIVLSATGTWYLGSTSSGSSASFTKIEFIAPKCEQPQFNALANSDICSGDPYVALDGTGTVTDGGTITYKWYAEGGTDVLGTDATYMPTADGSYFVVALHHVDGYTDNEATSDVVTVTTHTGTAISEGLVNQRGVVDAVVTLTVTASGKDLHYTWKECATIDGTYTDVAGAADAASLNVTITEGLNKYFKVIVHGDCGEDQESIAKVEQFVAVSQQDVTGSTVWDWTEAASVNEIKLTSSTTPKKNEGFVMANGAATVYNNANFESDKLYLEGEYIVRSGNLFQGQTIKFNTTVAGAVRVTFSHTGSNKPARELFINGVGTGTSVTGTSQTETGLIEVSAGEVAITAFHVNPTDGAGQQYVRVYKIEFYAYDTERNDSWIAPGELGTICYPNGHIITGAEVYEMAGVDENNKFVFDQVEQTEPGKPYLFVATSYEPIKLYKTTAAAEVSPIANHGMIGTFVSIDLDYTDERAAKWYYFSGKKFYAVSKRTSDLNVPANRAYVDMNTPVLAGAPRHGVRRITFDVQGANIATGIEKNAAATDKPAKMLINGQLFILRGEKMYDAKGQLVK